MNNKYITRVGSRDIKFKMRYARQFLQPLIEQRSNIAR
jgi:hypothetical protein